MDFEQAKPLIKQHALKSDENLRIAYWTYQTWHELSMDISRAFYNDLEKELVKHLNENWKVTNTTIVLANEMEAGVFVEKVSWGGALQVGMYRERVDFAGNFYGVSITDQDKTLLPLDVLQNITSAIDGQFGRGKANFPYWAWYMYIKHGFRNFRDNIDALSVISGVNPDARSSKLSECAVDICTIADIVALQVDDFIKNNFATT